jgi:tRNA pseudouridine38-40 synthase
MAVNKALPKDIVVMKAENAPRNFNARHHAKSKVYRYTIFNKDFLDPLIRNFAVRCFYNLNLKLMKKAARILEGRHDFKAFQAKDAIERKSVRTVKYIKLDKDGDRLYIEVAADGFLYNMARNIVGTLVDVGRGRIAVKDVNKILRDKDRRAAGPTMPAKGLCLMKVEY